jgi:hypothetical protein
MLTGDFCCDIFSRSSVSPSGVLSLCGGWGAAAIIMVGLLPYCSLSLFINDRAFFSRESAAGLYRTVSYFRPPCCWSRCWL